MAKVNPFRFSTKYQDDESDLVYYGYRYLNTSTGRWLSRDPIEERAGPSLFAFVANAPVNACDALGKPALTYFQGTVIPGKCGQFSSWITWSLDNNTGLSDSVVGGVIVQYVNASFNVTLCDKAKTPFHFGPPSDVNIDPGAWPLYEAWAIPPGKSHPTRSGTPAVDDYFTMPGFGVGTKGSITISASASYFDGQSMPWDFWPTYSPPTGSLPSSRSFTPPAPPTSSVSRTLTATWDCCCREQTTQVSIE